MLVMHIQRRMVVCGRLSGGHLVAPSKIVFLGCSISLAIVDLGGVFQADAVIHVARDMVGGVGKLNGEPISVFQFNFGVFIFEHLLECEAFNSVEDGSHDRTREKVACEGRLQRSGWFGSLNFLWCRWRHDQRLHLGPNDGRGWIQKVVARVFVNGFSLM